MSIFEPLGKYVIKPATEILGGAGLSYWATKQSHKAAEDAELAAWNRQKDYNHPAMQKQRYIEAGLNPNLMYSGAGADAGNTNSSIHQRNPYSYHDTVQKYLTLEGMFAQNRLTNAEADYKNKESKLLGATGLRTDPNWLKTLFRLLPSEEKRKIPLSLDDAKKNWFGLR